MEQNILSGTVSDKNKLVMVNSRNKHYYDQNKLSKYMCYTKQK